MRSERLRPLKSEGVHLRCLVCLTPLSPVRVRFDQTCGDNGCFKAWKRAGRPWNHLDFVFRRRVNAARYGGDPDHLADYALAVIWLNGSRDHPVKKETVLLTCTDTDDFIDFGYNGNSGAASEAVAS